MRRRKLIELLVLRWWFAAFTEVGTGGFRAQDLAAEEQYVYFEELVVEVMDEVRHLQPRRGRGSKGCGLKPVCRLWRSPFVAFSEPEGALPILLSR
jgi:hypothetical protein